jgi:glyoxylase-like metal-dependent hydrolase (beta-lactamase superfamily II)
MVIIDGQVVIRRPVRDVFEFVADERNEPRYNPRMRRVEQLTAGPIGVGTRFRAETASLGRIVAMLIQCTGYEPPRRLESSASMPSMDLHGTLLFDPVAGGTLMRWSWQLEPRGPLRRLGPLIGYLGRRQEQRIWAGLKQVLEGGVDGGKRRSRVPFARERAPLSAWEVARDVYCLGPHGLSRTTVYLVRSGSSWVLIDAGWGKVARSIRQAAEGLFGVDTPPAAILLTHDHPDHVGAALELARAWGVAVYVHPEELALARGELWAVAGYAGPLDRWVVLPLLRLLGRRRREAVLRRSSLREVVRALDLDAGVPGLPDWQCVHTPGHTPGHVAFFRPADRVLVTGDAVVTMPVSSLAGMLLGRSGLSGPPWYTTWDWRAAKTSVAKLARLDPAVLATGHGRPLAGAGTGESLRAFADRFTAAGFCYPARSSLGSSKRHDTHTSLIGRRQPDRSQVVQTRTTGLVGRLVQARHRLSKKIEKNQRSQRPRTE